MSIVEALKDEKNNFSEKEVLHEIRSYLGAVSLKELMKHSR